MSVLNYSSILTTTLRTDEDLGCEELSPSSSFCEDPEKPAVLEDTSPLEEIR
jgi:hypothetical protein